MSTEANLDAYLRRINYAGSIAPTIETLSMLLRLHPTAIPFETLDPLMQRPVRLQLTDLEQKLVVERRGGCGIEHNLLLKAVLESMDFVVTPLAATRLRAGPAPAVDHLVLLVDVGGVPYLADVGCPDATLAGPLRLRADAEQTLPGGSFRLTGGHPRWQLDAQIDGAWAAIYEFTLTPLADADLVAVNDRAMAEYRDDLFAARFDGSRRHQLINTTLVTSGVSTALSSGEVRRLTSTLELRDVLQTTFQIQLPVTDQLDPALEKALRNGARG